MDIKDKLKLFQRIRNTKHAGSDLQLLKDKQPSHPYIPHYERDPIRYAYDIQYALLDVATEEEIIKNRTPKKTSSKTSTEKKEEDKTEENPIEKEEIADDGSSKTLTEDTTATTETEGEKVVETETEKVEEMEETPSASEEDSPKKK